LDAEDLKGPLSWKSAACSASSISQGGTLRVQPSSRALLRCLAGAAWSAGTDSR
jgi:hypothetical protein